MRDEYINKTRYSYLINLTFACLLKMEFLRQSASDKPRTGPTNIRSGSIPAEDLNATIIQETNLPIRMNGPPPQLTPEMMAALPSGSEPRWTKASLLTLAPPTSGTARIPYQHCRRCHQVFDEWTNKERDDEWPCQIVHVVPPRTHSHEFLGEGDWQVVRTDCCNTRAFWTWDDESSSFMVSYPRNAVFCYQGKHTSSADEVDYNEVSVKPCTAICYWRGLDPSAAGSFNWIPEAK